MSSVMAARSARKRRSGARVFAFSRPRLPWCCQVWRVCDIVAELAPICVESFSLRSLLLLMSLRFCVRGSQSMTDFSLARATNLIAISIVFFSSLILPAMALEARQDRCLKKAPSLAAWSSSKSSVHCRRANTSPRRESTGAFSPSRFLHGLYHEM